MTTEEKLTTEYYLNVVESIEVSSSDIGATVLALAAVARSITELTEEVRRLRTQLSDDMFGINQEINKLLKES